MDSRLSKVTRSRFSSRRRTVRSEACSRRRSSNTSSPSYLLRFLELAYHKLKPGGRIVLETLNPACWVAFFESYIRDITHRWPLHPETLKYLVIASGFASASIEWRSPVPPQDRLQPIRVPADADALSSDLAEVFNANVEKLNARLFTHMDYAIVGQKGPRAVD